MDMLQIIGKMNVNSPAAYIGSIDAGFLTLRKLEIIHENADRTMLTMRTSSELQYKSQILAKSRVPFGLFG